ncbi:unnamed protein product [Peniophora sp. CBMAI 1063]|nr:unnamed protein product [Peniophora sp. CBMAI 1063]
MSGPVRNHSRRLRATALASPYAKKAATAQPKSSGWSIGGILSALNPFKRAQSNETDEDDYEAQQRGEEEEYEEDERPYTPPPPAAALSMRGREMAGETPSRPIDIDALSEAASPGAQSNNAEVVARYLAESKGRSLAEQEIHTLVSLLRSPTHDQPQPPRKLALSPAPSPSALRAAAPLPFSFATPPSPAPANPFDFSSISQTQTQSQQEQKPKRTIPRDPNAPIYKFTGAGSAKQNGAARPRTRYVSPAFGSPARSRAQGAGIALSPPPVQKGDAKRRKLEERSANAGPASPAKSASPAKEKEKAKEDEPQMPATPRPRHAVAVVRAGMGAPAVPSPLRNGWHASPDSSPGSPTSAKKPATITNGNGNGISGLGMSNGLMTPNKPTRASSSVNGNGNRSPMSMSMSPARSLSGDDKEKPRSTPTKAAATLSALIAETAPPPPPRPEVANPYQAALPARVQTKRPARKRKVEDISKAKSAEEGEKKDDDGKGGEKGTKEEEIGLDRIIEATAPKGSKRARPPPDLAAAPKPSSINEPRRSARLKSPEPSVPAAKQTYRSLFEDKEKPKPNGKPVVEEVMDEEEEDEIVEMSPPKKAKTTSSSAFGASPSPFGAATGATAATSFGTAPSGPPKSGGFGGLGNGLPSSKPTSTSTFFAPTSQDHIVVEEVSAPPSLSSAPGLVAKPTEVIEPEDATGKKESGAGKGKPPAFAPRAPSKLRFATVADEEREAEEKEKEKEKLTAAPPPPLFDAKLFASTVASAAAAASSTTSTSTPSSGHAAAAKQKDPKAAALAMAVPDTYLPAFTFHVVSAPGPITPSTSGSMDVDRPELAKDEKAKEAARRVGKETLPLFSFNASLPASSPGAGPSKLSSTSSSGGGGGGGFNWAAAGIKAPAKDVGGWTCGTCMVPNKAGAGKCVSCEEPAPKSASSSSAAGTNGASAGGGGFNWAAAGMKAPAKDVGGWTCGTCMVPNKSDAAKCVSCEEPAPKSTSSTSSTSGGGFNWAAAGMKAPAKDVGGWTCGVCMVPNKAGAGKCVACDSDRA